MNSIKTKKGVKKDGGEINVKYQKKLTNYFSANSLSTTF
jgi:ribosomal protein S17E